MPFEVGPITVIDDAPAASASPMSSLGNVALQTLGNFADRLATNYANKLAGVNTTPATQPAPDQNVESAPAAKQFSLSPWLIGGAAAVGVLGLVLILRNR